MATWKLPPIPQVPKAPPVSTENVTSTGADELIARLTMLPQVANAKAMARMLDVAEQCMEDSKENYCPFLNGILRQSGVVYVAEGAGVSNEIVLSYGGEGSGAELYAREQHENMSYDHHGIGGPKYLERAVMAWTDRIVQAAGQGVRETVELISTGWGSGDWKQIRVLRERPIGAVVQGYMRKGKPVATHFRRTGRGRSR
jgi:hypothetical protein